MEHNAVVMKVFLKHKSFCSQWESTV